MMITNPVGFLITCSVVVLIYNIVTGTPYEF